jgi:hypothetical protein
VSHTPRNPYYHVGGIGDPALFFNRAREIDATLNILLSSAPQCVAVVGQRKIGKTSFVKHLSRPSTLEQAGYDPRKHLFVFFDCQVKDDALKGREGFYAKIIECLLDEAGDLLGGEPPRPADTPASKRLGELLKLLGSRGVSVVMIFDEFDKAIVRETLIGDGFFGSLRGYKQAHANFAWVTCTSRSLYDLFKESFDKYDVSLEARRSESDFFNITTPIELNLFAEPDVDDVINVPAKAEGVEFSPSSVRAIKHFGGRFPFFLQRACYHFFDAHEGGEVDGELVLQRCVRNVVGIWESFWEKLDDEERALAVAIAEERELSFSPGAVSRLTEAALCYDAGGRKLKLFSEAFREFVLSKSEETDHLGLVQKNALLKSENEALKGELEEARKDGSQLRAELEAQGRALAGLRETDGKVSALEAELAKQTKSSEDWREKLEQKSLHFRLLLAFIVTTIGLQLIFLHQRFVALPAIERHPKKFNLTILCVLILASIDWAIIDVKHWRMAAGAMALTAVVGLLQVL